MAVMGEALMDFCSLYCRRFPGMISQVSALLLSCVVGFTFGDSSHSTIADTKLFVMHVHITAGGSLA